MASASDILQFWGKASPEDGSKLPFHPLPWHALDVAAAFEALVEAWPGAARKILDAFDAPPESHPAIVRTLSAVVALHDIGKFAYAFQAKVPDRIPAIFGIRSRAAPYRHDLGAAVLYDRDAPFRAALEALIPHRDAAALLDPIFFHHGRLRDGSLDLIAIFRPEGLAAARAFAAAMPSLFGAAVLPPLRPRAGPALSWRLAGLTALADWIGSNTRWFQYAATDRSLEAYLAEVARRDAHNAVRAAGLSAAAPARAGGFAALTGSAHPPTSAQAWAETVGLAEGAGLYILEDAMGSGKTEAAVVLAHRLMQAGRGDGLYVALPTMATANAIFDRLGKVYRRLFADGEAPSLALAHSAASLHPGFRKAVDIESQEDRGYGGDSLDETASSQCTRWITEDRRRAFFADVGVGTVDQALMAVLPATHAPIRQLGLSRRILVVDEAHAYDAYMQEELGALVEFQAALGGSTIILSATLPGGIKTKLAARFSSGLAGGRSGRPPELVRRDYPLATAIGGTVNETPLTLRPDLARTIAVRRIDGPEAALQRVVEHVASGAAVVYIRNTVDDAIETVEALRQQGIEALLFHARYALCDRMAIEAAAVDRFGAKSTPDERRGSVLVATQVVEQSLDIDFDAMITDLAPVDLMIQRAGRLWRHTHRARPVEAPVLEVVSPIPVDDPPPDWVGAMFPRAQWVYRDHALLWLSARALFWRGALTVPDDLRPLVDGVYGGDGDLHIPKGLDRRSQDEAGRAAAAAGMARQNVLCFSNGYQRGSAHVWQDDLDIPTRLAEPTTTFRLARWDGQSLRPWSDDADERRAWRLSEVSVRTARAARPAPGSPAAEAAAQLESVWRGRHDPAVVLPLGGPDNRATLIDEQGRAVEARYDRVIGLRLDRASD